MHNIDRTLMESNYGEYPGEYETDEYGYEFEGEGEGDYEYETYGEYAQESPFNEAEEMELAAELLSVSNEAELDQFLGKIFKRVARKVGGFIKSPVGRALGGALRGVAKRALPMLGSAVSNVFAPGIGGVIGGKLAGAAGNMLGLELEGLSQEDQEFEVAKQVVRLAGAAASNAAQASPATPPQAVAQSALTNAAQQFAPGLLGGAAAAAQSAMPGRRCRHKKSGQWVRRGKAIGFENYSKVIDRVLCDGENGGKEVCKGDETQPNLEDVGSPTIKDRRNNLLKNFPTIYGVDAYNLLKLTTQAFLLFETGVAIQEPRVPDGKDEFLDDEKSRQGRRNLTYDTLRSELENFLGKSGTHLLPLPYLQRIVRALLGDEEVVQRSPFCEDLLQYRFTCPSLLELIWSYWHEEGMLVQTMNAICMRFQNRRGPADRDPLANLELDPLRPLNNLLWGYIQDEYNRLTVQRRAYEYDHHYGLKIIGKAVPELRSADSRSKFIEAFHNLLYRTAQFYREDADTNIIADGFPLLNSLREVHILLAEGAHNQFGDLPWTARAEMLMMEWMIARPEMREFLRGRAMVPYDERWMGQVDTMKRLQGWTDTSITHFRHLGVYGEQLLLAVRYGDWVSIKDQEEAKTWARYWRPEIQGYIHAYLAATGVDLSEDITDTRRAAVRYVQPAILLQNRMAAQGSQGSLPSGAAVGSLAAGSVSFSALPSPRRRALKPAGNE